MAAKKAYFIVGTDTGVGKTVVTSVMTRYLLGKGVNVMAVKPFCSGGRDDAQWIREALGKTVSLDEINPWHFRAPLTPLLAARKAGVTVKIGECLRFLQNAACSCDTLLIEGAGGLLSPLGEGFDARDLIVETKATPLIVCRNQLGAINQVRLVLAALPKRFASRSRVVVIENRGGDIVAKTNVELLREMFGKSQISTFPKVAWPDVMAAKNLPRRVVETMACLIG